MYDRICVQPDLSEGPSFLFEMLKVYLRLQFNPVHKECSFVDEDRLHLKLDQ